MAHFEAKRTGGAKRVFKISRYGSSIKFKSLLHNLTQNYQPISKPKNVMGWTGDNVTYLFY